MSHETGPGELVGGQGRQKIGIVLYTSPSTSLFRLGVELAQSALRGGYEVEMFAWGDAVYAASNSTGEQPPRSYFSSLMLQAAAGSGTSSLRLHVCTSCCKSRGLSPDSILSGVHLGGMHNMVSMFRECHRTLVMVP